LLSAVALLFASTAWPQDAVAAASTAYKVEIDNQWVRVLRLTLAPHQRAASQTHPP